MGVCRPYLKHIGVISKPSTKKSLGLMKKAKVFFHQADIYTDSTKILLEESCNVGSKYKC
jgi:hypothetical protein